MRTTGKGMATAVASFLALALAAGAALAGSEFEGKWKTADTAGKDYEIWVLEDGVPQRAGLFERPGVAVLTRPVESGQTVAVTLEPDGGVDAPTGEPLFTASRA